MEMSFMASPLLLEINGKKFLQVFMEQRMKIVVEFQEDVHDYLLRLKMKFRTNLI